MPRPLYIASSLIALAAAPATPPIASGGASPQPVGDARIQSIAPAVAAPRPDGRRVLSINRSPDGLFYVEAQVNGASVHFVVDSGASVVVLSATDAARASVGGNEGMSVETAGGASPMRRAQIKQVVLAGKLLSNVDAAIVNRDLKVSLLGQSALSQFDSVTFKGDRLDVE